MNYEQVCEYYRQRLGYTDDEGIIYEVESTAYHEAGHFVMNMAFDAMPRHVTIAPNSDHDTLGSVGNSVSSLFSHTPHIDAETLGNTLRDLAGPAAVRNQAAKGLLVLFAGSVAAEVHGYNDFGLDLSGPDGETIPEGATPTDAQTIQRYLDIAFDPAEHGAVYQALYELTWQLMARRGTYNAVGVVAQELLQHITLDDDQMEAITRRARRHLRLHHVQVVTMIEEALATLK